MSTEQGSSGEWKERSNRPRVVPPWGDLDFVADQVFGAPWHFQWRWHNGQPPTASSQDRTNGQIQIATFADQDNNWSDAHGGSA